jgi:hypothetical protein
MRPAVIAIALLLFLIINQNSINERQRRIQQLREELGPGRGRVPRADERSFPAVDVYANMVLQGDPSFRGVTRFTQAQFADIVTELRPLIMANRHVRMNVPEPTGQLRSGKLSVPNRVLLTIKFLVFGSSLADLSEQFGLSVPAVNEELHHGVYAIVEALYYEIQWPDPARQQQLREVFGGWFANAIGVVDGSFTPSFRQPGDFSGHRHANVRSHQIATDSLGYVIHVVAGQIGSRHDAYNYQVSDLPALLAASGANMLADVGYEGCEELGLILPATAESIPNSAARKAFNRRHKSRRSRIEQHIGLLKALFAVVARRWQRTDRQFLAVCVVASCCLYNRWRRLRL